MTPDEVQDLQAERQSYRNYVHVRQQAYQEGASVAREIALTDLVRLIDELKNHDFVILKSLPKAQAVEASMGRIWDRVDQLEKTLLNGVGE